LKGILKWPLILAAAATVLRVVVELAGAPGAVSNLISVVALHLVIVPVYFAIRIAKSGVPHPYLTQFKLTVLYVVLARAMVIPTYWLAYIYQWDQSRFSQLMGPDVGPFAGYIAVPFATAGIWIVVSTIFGGGVGSIIIAASRGFGTSPATGDSHRQ
jgi:hypothetical protein